MNTSAEFVAPFAAEPRLPQTLDILIDRPRAPIRSDRRASVMRTLPRSLATRLTTVATTCRISVRGLIVGAFATLLRRSTGRSELLIGIGDSTSVVRAEVDCDEAFARLAVRIDDRCGTVSRGADALADVVVNYDDSVVNDHDSRDVADESRQTAAVDLVATVRPTDDGDLTCRFEYSPELFDQASIALLLEHFCTLLTSVADDADVPIARLPMASPAELELVMNTWCAAPANAATVPRAFADETIHALVSRSAVRRPDAIALIEDGDTPLTYAQLEASANRLAHALRARGVKRGARVGLFLERSIEAVVAMLATLKAGGAYVPLDPSYPPERIAFMVTSAEVSAIITDRHGFAGLGAYAALGLDVASASDKGFRADEPPTDDVDGNALAYVMFTSGSTGKPKAVGITHRNVVGFIGTTELLALAPHETGLLHSALTFDLSVIMTWPPLFSGARLAVMPAAPFSLVEMEIQLQRHDVTTLVVVTPVFHDLVDERLAALRGLRVCIVAGDALAPQQAMRFASNVPTCRLINGYGPTEATVLATAHEVRPTDPPRRSVPIGVPIGEARVVVLDASGEPVAAGVPGELWIGGGGVAVGYLNDEAMTRERFVPDPFATDPRARLYRSGDRARWLPNGELEFLGRADSQVKIRGFRIEPAEIEFAMLEHPAVRHAAVVVRPSTSAGHELDLIGYVELRDARLNEATLRDFLSVKLPSYAIPARFVLLETLPKTASDKIDRNALPVPPSRTTSAQEIAPALDELHQQLIRLWERLLGTTPIGIRDNFFALGGNSLLAARLIGQIEREFQARLPLAVLFEHPTVEALALALRRDPANLNRSPLVVLNPEGSAPPLFFLHGSITGGGYYCLALAKHVGNDRPIFAMRPHGVDGGDVPGSIAEAAATNIDALIAKQPQGPYILGGFSSAALVAYEMALQLTQRGHVVDNVVLIDAPYAGPVLRAGVAIVERCGPRLGISATRRNAISALLWRLAQNLDRLRVVNDKRTFWRERSARLRGAFAHEPVNGEPAESSELGNQWLRITAAYRLRPYSGRLTLLFSAEATPRTIRAWSIAAPRVDRRSIPGTHFTCITDHIAETAHTLAAAL